VLEGDVMIRTSELKASSSRIALRALVLLGCIALAEAPGIVMSAGPVSAELGTALAMEVLSHFVPFTFGLAFILELHEVRRRFSNPVRVSFVAAVLAVAFAVLSGASSSPSVSMPLGMSDSVESFRLHEIWTYLVETLVALVFVMKRDGSRNAESQLHQHALQWRLARRRADSVVARTALMRVEPEVLFQTLRTTRSLFVADADRADASLEALTTYLRAVLRTGISGLATFGDEIDLAAARMRLDDFADCAQLSVTAEPAARTFSIATGTLPQLLYAWSRTLAEDGLGRSSIEVSAAAEDGRLVLRFNASRLPPRELLEPLFVDFAAASDTAIDDIVRFHGRGAFTLYCGKRHDE
jgi:hypothetical protein